MGNTIYASFNDPRTAEKAAGALMDHGVRPEDISVVQAHDGRAPGEAPIFNSDTGYWQNDNTRSRESQNQQSFSQDPEYPATDREEPAREVPPPYLGPRLGDPAFVNPPTGLGVSTAYGIGTPTGMQTAMSGGPTFDYDQPVDVEDDTERMAKEGISTTTSGDAGEGALKGTAWGAGLGIIAGVATLFVPGVGLVYGAGALAAAIGAAAATAAAGAVAGAVTGYLVDQGVDTHVAQKYNDTVTGGGALLAVTLPSGMVDEDRARVILDKYAAYNITAYASKGYLS